jgi:hypothetical protein
MAYVVKAAGSELNEEEVIQFVAGQQVCHGRYSVVFPVH